MREHMYCELTEKKTPNQVPAHITFLSPTPTVTGKDNEAMTLTPNQLIILLAFVL